MRATLFPHGCISTPFIMADKLSGETEHHDGITWNQHSWESLKMESEAVREVGPLHILSLSSQGCYWVVTLMLNTAQGRVMNHLEQQLLYRHVWTFPPSRRFCLPRLHVESTRSLLTETSILHLLEGITLCGFCLYKPSLSLFSLECSGGRYWICRLSGGDSFCSNKCFLFFMKPENLSG